MTQSSQRIELPFDPERFIGCLPGPGGHGRHLGSVARTLLYRAHCPVLVVPTGPESTGPSLS